MTTTAIYTPPAGPSAFERLVARIEFMGETAPGAGRPHVTRDHLSGSQIKAISRCGTAYYFERALALPSAKNSSLVKGSAIHDGIAAGLQWKRDCLRAGNVKIDSAAFYQIAQASALKTIEKELKPSVPGLAGSTIAWDRRWQKGPLDTRETLTRDVEHALELFANEHYPQIHPLRVESGYFIFWRDDRTLPVLGYTDLVYKDPQTGVNGILDWKTSTKIKTQKDLTFDNALIGYAHGAQHEIGEPISEITYGCIVFNAPEKGSEDAKIRIEILKPIPYTPQRITRLYSHARNGTITRVTGHYSLQDGPQTCPTCPFIFACSEKFGTLDPVLLGETAAEAPGAHVEAA